MQVEECRLKIYDRQIFQPKPGRSFFKFFWVHFTSEVSRADYLSLSEITKGRGEFREWAKFCLNRDSQDFWIDTIANHGHPLILIILIQTSCKRKATRPAVLKQVNG
jgi:hypothetical protein